MEALRNALFVILYFVVVCKADKGLAWLFTHMDSNNEVPPKPVMALPTPLARQSPREVRIPLQLPTLGIVTGEKTTNSPSGNVRVCPNDRVCMRGQYCDLHYEICRDKVALGKPCRRDEMCQPGNDCMFGYCQQKVRRGQEGARCRGDDDCGSDMCCAPRHGQKVCQRLLQEGHKCYVPEGGLEYALNGQCPCGSGLVCRSVSWHPSSENHSSPRERDSVPGLPPVLLALEGMRCVGMA
ncbi:dickkopf-related protein 3-like [Palaemon carinicauda]|uniref:dickkopf-related protein 3-like n=1 Tax=Palaemon carinicauda TaxID=392227 RepID=UPI0035B61FB3